MTDAIPEAAIGSFEPMPKASIGNYKGVMLCNRPNEFGQQRRPEPTGPVPFRSRVDPKTMNPVGWNPTAKVFPKSRKKKDLFKGVLNRHKQFIQNLQVQKQLEKEELENVKNLEMNKTQKFKDQAAKQRLKIKEMKENQAFEQEDVELEFEDQQPAEAEPAQPEKLTEEALSKMDQFSQKKSVKSLKSSTKSKKSQKPAWATTEKQQEEEKEKEIDDLLEFAYDLDYDKYMDDFEVRQAFEIIKDRVHEIK